ncbi:MAG: SIS domain-containing protein [Chloroflexi bacterium]|nr:SIS domain-containing protein [Chloroflexota bacterium]MBI3732509.1 SIS domain-containing protein [Chloroflexota bacterium]
MTNPTLRTGHPYQMYDAMQAQPAAINEVLRANADALDAAAALFAPLQSLYLCGIGTSFHAALVAEYLLRLIAADRPLARAVHSFEFVRYPPPIRPNTGMLIFSHRGTKNYSLQALDRANALGAPTAVITGKGSGANIHKARVELITVEQEISAAHTVSYTTALALFAALAIRLARRVGQDTAAIEAQLAQLPSLIQRALQTEQVIRQVARALAGKTFIAFVGGGPNAATAYEVALKMKETNYTPCEGFEVEQFLHGPLCLHGAHTAVWVIASPGPSYERCWDIVRSAKAIGATTIAQAQEGDSGIAASADHSVALPAVGEALSPLVHVVPLQLLSYHLALVKGANPDSFHRDDARHESARQFYTL